MDQKEFSTIGRVTRRKDGISKVTGKEIYASDVTFPNMLYGKAVRSPYPHAKVISIDTSAAEKMGAICIVYDDVPKIRYNERQVSIPQKTYRDRTILANVVRHVGEAVAAVAAKSEALAEKAMRSVVVEYEQLPPFYDAEESMKPNAPKFTTTSCLGMRYFPSKKILPVSEKSVKGMWKKDLQKPI